MTSLENLQYFSILRLILLHQNYSTIWIYSDQFNSDVIREHFMEKYEYQPKSFFDLKTFQTPKSINFNFEQKYFQDTTHVLFINQSFDERVLDYLRIEDNLVVITDNENVDRIVSLKKDGQFGRKILFITNLNLCLLKPSKTRYVLETLSFHSNESVISNFVRNAVSPQYLYSQYNMNGSVFKIFFRQKGANSFITIFDNKLMFFGPDGFTVEQISKLLNGTVNSNTDYGIDEPNYMKFFTEGGYPYNDFIYFYKQLVTTNVISSFNQSISRYADLYMSSQQLTHESATNRTSNRTTDFLYPHIRDCLRVIVPSIVDIQTFPIKLIKNQYCQSIIVAFILMSLFKIIFGGIVVRKWENDIFTTLSIFLAQGKTTKSSRSWESIWMWLLVTLSLITTTLLSAICYKTIVSVQFQKQINSLQDLMDSNLTIFVSRTLTADIEAWGSSLNPKFIEKIVIGEKLYMLDNEQFAFVWPEGMAEMVLKFPPANISVGEVRIMKEPLYCGLVAHRVPSKSPLKKIFNTVTRRMIEHGLRDKQLEWSKRFFNAMASKQLSETCFKSTSDDRSLNFSKLSGVFIMYGFGICISLIAALIELLWKRITGNTAKVEHN